MSVAVGGIKKAPRYQCTKCGITAAEPIVVPKGDRDGTKFGVCSNAGACTRRVADSAKRKAAM